MEGSGDTAGKLPKPGWNCFKAEQAEKGEWRSRAWTIPSDGGSQGKKVGIGVERGFFNMRYNSLLV